MYITKLVKPCLLRDSALYMFQGPCSLSKASLALSFYKYPANPHRTSVLPLVLHHLLLHSCKHTLPWGPWPTGAFLALGPLGPPALWPLAFGPCLWAFIIHSHLYILWTIMSRGLAFYTNLLSCCFCTVLYYVCTIALCIYLSFH